jgi:phosphate-selective porin OprO/OprP
VVGHYSYADFNGGTITGGKYWRITPMLNWYFSDNTRLELTYGYGSLNKFGLTGKTHFFQLRIQLQL